MPTTDTVVIAASGGDYTSLFSAEAAEQGDYVTADKIMEYSHQLAGDTTAVTFSGSTTDATRYIRVFAPSGWRHAGVWDATKSYIDTSNTAISCTDSFIRFEGIQLKITGANKSGIAPTPSDGAIVKIDSCIVRCGGSAQNSFGIKCDYNSSGNRTLLVSNSSFYDWINGTNSASGIYVYNGWTAYCYACTVVNCYIGLYRLSFGATAIPTLIAKNNLIRSCTTAASGTFAAGTDYNATDNASMGYTVTGGGNTHDRVGAFFTFTDESGDDFSLAAADGGAKRYGVDLSGDANLPFSTDITGATRSGTWDIGAHQHVSSAATGTKFVRYIENLTAVTTTATALKSRIQLTLAAADQAASTDYLIIGYAEVANATAGAKVDLHLVNVTDSVTYQDLEPAPALSSNGDNIDQTMYGVYTSASTPVEKNFEIRFAAVSGTAQIKNAHITVIKLEAADKYDESTAKIDSTTSYADAASVTFTPASQGFYWIFGATEALHSAGHLPRARLTVGGTLQTAIEEVDTPTASARTALALSWVEELAASSQTIALGVRDAGGSTDFYNTRVFAIRLDGFPDYWYAEEATNDTTPATSFEAKASLTETFPAVRHLAIANIPARSSGTASINIVTSLRDDSTVKREGITRPRQPFATEGTDSMSLAYSFTGSGSSKTIDAGWHFNSSASGNLPTASLLVIQLESAGVSGTASITEAADTVSAAGTVRIAGTASITEAADTSSGTATILLQAAAAITDAGDTIAATGALAGAISGTASITEASDVVSSAGTVRIAGTASISETSDTAASTSTIRISGAATITEASDTASTTGTVGLSAAATITESGDTATSAGTLLIAGTLAIAEASDTIAATGNVAIAGTCTIAEAGDTCAATGTFGSVIAGTASIAEANDTCSAAGTVRIAASVVTTEASDTASGTAQIGIAAAASIAEASDTIAATGRLALLGTATISEASDTVSSAGTILVIGGPDLPFGAYAFRWTHGERSMRWTHGERGFDWTHGERSFRHVDG